jgi:hypothetical protein
MRTLTTKELMTLAEEAQHSTLLAILWSSADDGFTSARQLGSYFLKWVDATKAAIEVMDDPSQQTKLAQDLATIVMTPLAGTRAALREFAEGKKIELPPSKLTGKEDAITFKKMALAEINELMVILKEYKDKQEGVKK